MKSNSIGRINRLNTLNLAIGQQVNPHKTLQFIPHHKPRINNLKNKQLLYNKEKRTLYNGMVGGRKRNERELTNSSALHKEAAESIKNCCDRRQRRLATVHKKVRVHGNRKAGPHSSSRFSRVRASGRDDTNPCPSGTRDDRNGLGLPWRSKHLVQRVNMFAQGTF